MPTIHKLAKRKKRAVKKSASVIDRIAPIGFDDDEGISINFYGRSGTGKTTVWATFPKPILVMVVSGGKRPGELRSIDTLEYRKTIKSVTLRTTEEADELIRHQEETEEYATFVLDHLTAFQGLKVQEILGLGEIPVAYYRKAGKGESWGLVSQSQWGQCNIEVIEIMRRFLGLRCNRVVVAQERAFDTEDESGIINPWVASAATKGLTGWLAPACDYVCQTFIKPRTEKKTVKIGKSRVTKERRVGDQKDYCLRTAPHEVYASKFRVPKGTPLPEYIVDPTYAKIKALIDGKG